MDFSTYFKEKREKANLSQAEVAKQLGISKRTVSSWETGENEPQPKMRRKIEEMFSKIEMNMQDSGRPNPGDKLNPTYSLILALLDDYAEWKAEEKGIKYDVVKEGITKKATLILKGLDSWLPPDH